MIRITIPNRRPTRRLFLFSVLAVLLCSGCRTYGGYGSEEVLYNEIQRLAGQLEKEVEDVRSDLALLEGASTDSPFLGLVANQLARILEINEAFLAEHEEALARLSPGSSHRSLYRTYGAMVSSRQILQNQIRRLLETAYGAYGMGTARALDLGRPYANVPPYYVKVSDSRQEFSVQGLIRAARSGRTPSPEAYALLETPIPRSSSARSETSGQESVGGVGEGTTSPTNEQAPAE